MKTVSESNQPSFWGLHSLLRISRFFKEHLKNDFLL